VSTRSVGMGAPFGWLMKALDAGRRNPTALFGGFAMMMLVVLVPSAVQFAADKMLVVGSAAWIAVYAVAFVGSLVLAPPLAGAAFRLLDACERGLPVRASAIFDGFRLPGFLARMVLLMLAFVAVYLLVLAVLYALLPGKDVLFEYFRRALAVTPGAQPDFTGLAPPPGGLFLWMLGSMFLLLVLGNAYMLAFAQAALAGRGIVDSLRDGFAGAFRNLLPFLGFAIAMFFVALVVALVLMLVVGLVAVVLTLVSPVLAVAVLAPVYVALLLGVYVIMFAYYYHAWLEIFGGERPAPVDDSTLAA
jgi:hypothetical protein